MTAADNDPGWADFTTLAVALLLLAAVVTAFLVIRQRQRRDFQRDWAQYQQDRKLIVLNRDLITQAIDRIYEVEAENDELRAALENAFVKARRPLPPELAQAGGRQHLHVVKSV